MFLVVSDNLLAVKAGLGRSSSCGSHPQAQHLFW